MTHKTYMKCALTTLLTLATALALFAATPVESLTFNGQVDTNQASFVLTGRLKGQGPEELEPKLIYSLTANAGVRLEKDVIAQQCLLTAKIHQGRLKELAVALRGDGEVTNVTGAALKDWGVRFDAQGRKYLVIRPVDPPTNTPPPKEFAVTVLARHPYKQLPVDFTPLCYTPESAAFFDGTLEIKPHDAVELALTNVVGLLLVREERALTTTQEISLTPNQPFTFRFSGGEYGLLVQVRERDAEGRKVNWEKFQLTGELKERRASFTLTGEAVVKHPEGGTLAVLAGEAALTSYPTNAEMKFENGRYLLRFKQPGAFPLELKFDARVTPQNEWNNVNFEVVSSSLRPVTLKGLPGDTQFQFAGAAKPERQGEDFVSFLPSAGRVQLQWKEARKEELGKLFYSVQGTVHLSVGPGLLRQTYLMDYRVMQGELTQLVFDLAGAGEVTHVRGNNILSWKTEPGASNQRRLTVQLNQPRKDNYQVVIQTQTPLGVFPLKIQPLRLTPVQAIRYGGYLAAVNDGAVKLEVTEARGLSQISPELYPQSKELQEAGVARGTQVFAYRFSGGDYSLALQADHILPELSVSQILVYHLGETETFIDAELELDIRDAPLREFALRIPSDFTNTTPRLNLTVSEMQVTPDPATGAARLRLVFTSPLTGRQVIQMRLSKNTNAVAGAWTLPLLQPQGAKSVRGQVGVSAETGFRLTAGPVTGLTDIAPALFQRRVAGLQLAWRLREEAWSAVVNVERLALNIQADVLHLFTLKEGIIYGSSVMNYLVSGAPVNQLRVAVPDDFTNNVEFAGKDVRNWRRLTNAYEVYFNTPIYGAYTLLATYDRQFNTRTNNTAAFDGAVPLDVQVEHGSVLVVSEFQFEVAPAQVSPNLLKLDPVEIPPEHRLLFDAPILAAYQYTARPFALRLALSSLPPGETMHQVADRALLTTQISREGEVLTTATYFLKNQGHSHLRLRLPPQTDLWEARVNGQKVMPVTDRAETLIPLPPKADPTAVLTVSLKLAAKSDDKKLVQLATPALRAPVLQTEWQLKPDERYRLQFSGGGVAPVELQQEGSGFAWLKRAVQGEYGQEIKLALLLLPALWLVGAMGLRWATRPSVYRWSAPNLAGLLPGLLACGAAGVCLAGLAQTAGQRPIVLPTALTFIAPVQAADQALSVAVTNLPVTSRSYTLLPAWPAGLAVLLWLYLAVKGVEGGVRKLGVMAGWTLAAWAALRAPNGAAAFLWLLVAFIIIHLVIPALRCQLNLRPKPPQPKPEPPQTPATPEAGAATALLLLGLFLAGSGMLMAAEKPDDAAKSVVQSVVQQGQVEEGFVRVQAQLTWKTEANQRLDFLAAPAVLTKITYPENALTLTETKTGDQSVYRLAAKSAGVFDIRFEYQLTIPKDTMNNGFALPTPHGLVNRLTLEIDRPELEVFSSNAVTVESARAKRGEQEITRAEVVLAPQPRAQVSWRPRARDPRLEKPVFYGELVHLYIPTPGVIEGLHVVQVKPAQGQLTEVAFNVPTNLTITDVQGDLVANWRFDPDQKLLRVQFSAPQSKAFALRLRSQLVAGTLPYEQTVGVITLSQAAAQLGMAGVATGPEVSLDRVQEQALSRINLEDFLKEMAATFQQNPGLNLSKAYRYADATARLTLAASAVQPDVRVVSQDTISLGEDRIVLGSKLNVTITRAGIFKLSFVLPPDFEVENLTGAALSHWTELKADNDRVVTLHLKGKTEGSQLFNLTLAGPGLANRRAWDAPRLSLREASQQTGQLVIVPEEGIRLQVRVRDGLTLLDPRQAGITQKGIMAFRVFQSRWQLAFDVETVEPWIQAASLQDVNVREGQAQVGVNLEYRIENAGVKSFLVQVPAAAENVRFEGELLSDFVKSSGAAATNRWADWEVKLQRRVIGNYALRVTYQLPITNQAAELRIAGVKAATASLQRGFLAVRAGGRLQLKFPPTPASLQPAEWQSIPASLRKGKDLAESKDCFSILENDFDLAVGLARHEIAQLLPAQVESLTLTSVIAPSGEMLTEGRLLLHPGDLRLLGMKLPADARFWYAFVNGQSAWPWRQGDQILLLMEKNTDPKQPTSVEFFYTCPTSGRAVRGFNHQVLGPSFNLPLQNLTWNVYVPANWQVKDWESALQLVGQGQTIWPSSINLDAYIQSETARLQQKTKEAEKLILMGNEFLQGGAPQQARRAYQAAWRMSPQDAAFNEDARVQLNNVRMQQALLGLNQRRQAAFEFAERKDGKAPSPFTRVEPGQAPEYTQQQAQQILEQNPKEENDALIRLAERLIRQQSAGGGKPESIRAALPIQGRQYNFTGSLAVKQWADLNVKLAVKSETTRPGTALGLFLGGLFVVLLILGFLARNPGDSSRS